ncbi:uncharacterized protein LOC133803998 [Humulus lupulus]|uniref:uncharacterized protein LOC133800856 n=1 Tax=Humulus lupulus TaxID=3486 RepID=UPI002B40F4A1|nr:uncharacterized protein LOC133800856 [Humulus lupulus]XP_062098121.1 uncharacterized protein LOC133803998 [Humulus lupulus]
MADPGGFDDDCPLPGLDDDCPLPGLENNVGQEENDDTAIVHVRSVRGLCTMPDIAKMRSEGVKVPIKFNEYGQVIGTMRSKLGSMIGSTIKRCASITHASWDKVPKSDKEKFWEIIKATFDIDHKSKRKIMSRAAKRWRSFKSHLTKVCIYDVLDANPTIKTFNMPRGYSQLITKTEWDEFCVSRMTDDWKKIRKIHQDRRKKNKHNHHMSRGGYLLALERLQQKNFGLEVSEIDRSQLWLAGHSNKKGEPVGTEATSVARNIVSVLHFI